MRLLPREETNHRAATMLSQFILDLGISVRCFAQIAGVAESSLRYFLSNGNAAAGGSRHKRGPGASTIAPVLTLAVLPEKVRTALLDSVYYEKRIVAPYLQARLHDIAA